MDPERLYDELGLTHPDDAARFQRIRQARGAGRARLAGGTTLEVTPPGTEISQELAEEEPDLRTPEERRAHAASMLSEIRKLLDRGQNSPE